MERQYLYMEQGSPEWFAERAGRVTGSAFKKMFSDRRTASYKNIIKNAIEEIKTGVVTGFVKTFWMRRGNELEHRAVMHYKNQIDKSIQCDIVGFITYGEYAGASPDLLVGPDGMAEIKCPKKKTYLEYLKKGVLPKIYEKQVHGQLLVADRKWCDFVVYYPGEELFIIRVHRDPEQDAEIIQKIRMIEIDIQRGLAA